MAGFIEGVSRDQTTLFPERLDDWIGEDHLVRVVDLFVDQLDLTALGFQRYAAARTGRPGYHPAVLLRLFIYGYLNRIPSSRRLECEAGRNVEVMWLTGRLVPDHKTIADFRRRNGPAIRKTCAKFVDLCRRIGVLKGEVVAVDGSKFKAVNNRLAHLEVEVGRYIEEADRIDRQETGTARAERAAHLTGRYRRIRQEIERLLAMDKALADCPDGQVSLTDPDARAMATRAQHSGHVGYNVQSVVDAETHLIVTHEVTNQGHDRDQLAKMATQAKATLQREDMHILADKGYFSALEILACHKAGITATVPRSDTSGARSMGHFVKADFAYDHGADIYRCPAGQALTYRTTSEQQGLQMRRYWTNACKACDLKSRCTTGHERRVSRWEHEHLVEASNARRRSPSAPMSVRRSTVEHPFGTIKSWSAPCHFLTRRLQGVRTEMALNVLAYNIKRMISLIGIRRLMEAIPG
jgi:transposase